MVSDIELWCQNGSSDSILQVIRNRVIVNYTSDSVLVNLGETTIINNTLRKCISYKNQPNYTDFIPMVESLYLQNDTMILSKLDILMTELIIQYDLTWNITDRVICSYLEVQQIKSNDSLLLSLQSLRYYYLLLKKYRNKQYQVYREAYDYLNFTEVLRSKNFSKEYTESVTDSLKKILNRRMTDIDYMENLIQNRKVWVDGGFGSFHLFLNIMQNKINDWGAYLYNDLENAKLLDYKQVQIANYGETEFVSSSCISLLFLSLIKNKSTAINDLIFNRKDLFLKELPFQSYRLLGITGDVRNKQLLEENFDSYPSFFNESASGFRDFVYGLPGRQIASEFFLSKLKEKLPKDKYLLAISAISRVPNQEVAELLKKEYRNQKDPYIKKAVINAIDQVYYRKHLADRPSREWFDEQRQLLTRKIEKLENTKPQDEK